MVCFTILLTLLFFAAALPMLSSLSVFLTRFRFFSKACPHSHLLSLAWLVLPQASHLFSNLGPEIHVWMSIVYSNWKQQHRGLNVHMFMCLNYSIFVLYALLYFYNFWPFFHYAPFASKFVSFGTFHGNQSIFAKWLMNAKSDWTLLCSTHLYSVQSFCIVFSFIVLQRWILGYVSQYKHSDLDN